jgi:acid phosphatase
MGTNRGAVDHTALNHYSLLKTLEMNFGMGDLGKSDVGATAFRL